MSEHTVVMTDVFATLADIIDQELPNDAAEDSISFLPTLLGHPINPHREAIFVLGDGKDSSIAVCSGQWKLVVRYDLERRETYELYDIDKDPSEQVNLQKKHPSVTKQLAGALKEAEASGRTRR